MFRSLKDGAIGAVVILLPILDASVATAQHAGAVRPWISGGVGVGGNWIVQEELPPLKGTPQAFINLGFTVPHGRRLGAKVEGTFSRELDAITGHCSGAARCYASGFSVVGASAALVTSMRDSLRVGSNTAALGGGLYHVPRTYSSNGNLAAATVLGAHAELQRVAWSGKRHAGAIGIRGAVLPKLHGEPAWMLHVTFGGRGSF